MRAQSAQRRKPQWRGALLAAALLGAALWGGLQWPVHTRQGVNHQLSGHTLPLYLKLARFVYRDVEYRHLAARLTRGARGDEAKMLRLYEWVRANIRSGTPPGVPVVDDHVWDIIVRRYGEADQLADVLATLCAYAGLPADLVLVGPPGGPPTHAVTVIALQGRWYPVDPFFGIIVRDAKQRMVSYDELREHPDLVRAGAPGLTVGGFEYAQLYTWLPALRGKADLRPYRHMPIRRAWDELRRALARLGRTS